MESAGVRRSYRPTGRYERQSRRLSRLLFIGYSWYLGKRQEAKPAGALTHTTCPMLASSADTWANPAGRHE
jgi:hypothetical protein